MGTGTSEAPLEPLGPLAGQQVALDSSRRNGMDLPRSENSDELTNPFIDFPRFPCHAIASKLLPRRQQQQRRDDQDDSSTKVGGLLGCGCASTSPHRDRYSTHPESQFQFVVQLKL